jgi:hypothetical protein
MKKSIPWIHPIQPVLVLFTVLTGCNGNVSSSDSISSSEEVISSSIASSSSPFESSENSSSQNPNLYTPEEPEFRFIGQNWNLSIANQNVFPIDANQHFVQLPESGQVTVGMTDAIGFGDNNHGGRMIRSVNTYYPEIGIEGLAYNGSLINNPYFYDQPDYLKRGLYVDLENQPGTFNFYTLAMFIEAHQHEVGPKLFMSASTSSAEYSEEKLQYDAWASAAWRMVETKDNTTTPVAFPGYQIARWLDLYGEQHDTLYLAALENDFIDANKQAMSCNDQTPIEGENMICGAETDAILRTGYGLDHSLFVGNYDPAWNKIQGLALGRYVDHTIYSFENGIDRSNSHTVPTVTGFLATLIALRREANLPELTSYQWKQLILNTADRIEPNYLSEINEFGTVVLTLLGREVNVLNKEAATACAIDGLCLS